MSADPISDTLVKVKNAGKAGKERVSVPFSKVTLSILSLLEKEGFVGPVKETGESGKRFIEIEVKYNDRGVSRFDDFKRISRVSQRVYGGALKMWPVQGGHGLLVVSTPEGVISGKDARNRKVGGEILCEVW